MIQLSEKSNAKEEIVSAAVRLFFSQGYHATGLNQIIKESNAPKGSLYYYFPRGKEELAIECIRKANEFIHQKFEETFAAYKNTRDAIYRFILDMANDAEASGFNGFMPYSFWTAVETSCISDQLRVACKGLFANWQQIIMKHLLMDGFDAKKARETAILTVSLIEGAMILSLTHQDKQPLLTAADYLSVLAKSSEEIV